ncbi:MAG: hypothetical protein H6624_03225 [Bdellovibrionaceae bacterium]|nr:hypothetical protein [Bdellovibrionales bacterium]MCB9083326.1 hypothetical protein [Pseudobdellovibrionaceae bacterium]
MKKGMSHSLFWFSCAAMIFTLLLAACGKDDKRRNEPAQACSYNHVWVEGRGCLQQCYGRPGFGWDPQTGACLQGRVTSCNFNQVWVPEYEQCFNQCQGLPGYGYIPGENRCVPGYPGGYTNGFNNPYYTN